MISAVIFDFGGVILRTQSWAGRRKWERRLGLSKDELEAIVFSGEAGRAAQRGEIRYAEHWAGIGDRFDLISAELKELEADFWAGDVLDGRLVNVIRGLRPLYQTALISNAFDDLRDSLTNQFAIADAFNVIVISAEEGVMKPDARIYQVALERLGVEADETVFVDDAAPNVEGAMRLGMKGIHFRPNMDLSAQLQAFGIGIS